MESSVIYFTLREDEPGEGSEESEQINAPGVQASGAAAGISNILEQLMGEQEKYYYTVRMSDLRLVDRLYESGAAFSQVAQERSVKLLSENMAKLHKLAEYLFKEETITGEKFMELMQEE